MAALSAEGTGARESKTVDTHCTVYLGSRSGHLCDAPGPGDSCGSVADVASLFDAKGGRKFRPEELKAHCFLRGEGWLQSRRPSGRTKVPVLTANLWKES